VPSLNRRRFAAFLACCPALPSLAQSTMSPPIKLIVPFAAGSAPDTIARLVGERLGPTLASTVVVENLAGAGGTVGVDRVAKAAPDGQTLVLSGDAALVIPDASGARPYDPLKDLAPISQLVITPNLLVVNPEVPARTVQEFIALVRSKPGRFSYASAGAGTSSHRGGELMNTMAGLDMVHVPYSKSPLPDVIAGHVQVFFANVANTLPLLREGKVRALAVSSLERLPVTPELPTLAESGFAGFEAVAWFGLLAPAGTPQPLVARLQAAVQAVVHEPALRSRLEGMGIVPVGNTAQEFARLLGAETRKWAGLAIKAAAPR
jgi:tripartite-type tricarboxylate transporter receptor subunit TctC